MSWQEGSARRSVSTTHHGCRQRCFPPTIAACVRQEAQGLDLGLDAGHRGIRGASVRVSLRCSGRAAVQLNKPPRGTRRAFGQEGCSRQWSAPPPSTHLRDTSQALLQLCQQLPLVLLVVREVRLQVRRPLHPVRDAGCWGAGCCGCEAEVPVRSGGALVVSGRSLWSLAAAHGPRSNSFSLLSPLSCSQPLTLNPHQHTLVSP